MRIGLSSSLEHDDPGQWARRMKELGCGAVVFPVDYTASEELVCLLYTSPSPRDS